MALVLGVGVGVLFARAAGNGFISLDDPSYVTQNAAVRGGLDAEGIAWAFTSFHSFNWHPITWLSHMLDVTLHGLEPAGHHATNVVLHAANTVLLFATLVRTTGALWASALAAALFGIHPLRVESVAWISERKDLLSGLFFLAAIFSYASYARRPGIVRYTVVLLWMGLSLLSKPMGVTLPAVLLLLDGWPLERRRSLRFLLLEKLPMVVLSGVSAFVTFAAQGDAVRDLAVLPLGMRIANALVSTVAYLGMAVWPRDLAVFYPHPVLLGRAGELVPAALGSAALLLAVSGIALFLRRRRPYLAVGWFWYLVTLLPVIGVVQVGAQALADRYTYLPLIGVGIAAAFAARDLARRAALGTRACAVLAALVIVPLAGLTWRQLGTWRTTETLYLHAVAVTRDNYFAHTNLGAWYRVHGELARAREQLELAIQAKPDYTPAYIELGTVLARSGDLEGAARVQERVLSSRPRNARAHNALGLVRLAQDRLDDARMHFERAVASFPEFAEAHNNLGLVLLRQGDPEGARRHFRRALALRPDAAPPRENLRAMGEKGVAREPDGGAEGVGSGMPDGSAER